MQLVTVDIASFQGMVSLNGWELKFENILTLVQTTSSLFTPDKVNLISVAIIPQQSKPMD